MTAPDARRRARRVLRGDLVLVGGGDPFFGDASAARLAQAVRAAGSAASTGAVVGDESAFDARRSGCCTGYDPDLGGVLSALAYDRGDLPRPRPPRRRALRRRALRRAAARRPARRRRQGRAGAAPADAKTSPSCRRCRVGELARFINVPSNNFAAEMLFKELGARFRDTGTTAAGADVVRDTLDDFGVRPRIVDGSGLSRVNRATPRQVVRLLERMHNHDVARDLPRLARRPGLDRHRQGAHARHAGRRPLPGQDRHAARRQRAGRLLPHARAGATSASRCMFNRANTYGGQGARGPDRDGDRAAERRAVGAAQEGGAVRAARAPRPRPAQGSRASSPASSSTAPRGARPSRASDPAMRRRRRSRSSSRRPRSRGRRRPRSARSPARG